MAIKFVIFNDAISEICEMTFYIGKKGRNYPLSLFCAGLSIVYRFITHPCIYEDILWWKICFNRLTVSFR